MPDVGQVYHWLTTVDPLKGWIYFLLCVGGLAWMLTSMARAERRRERIRESYDRRVRMMQAYREHQYYGDSHYR